VTFTPSSGGGHTITGSYGGDSDHGASQGAAAIPAVALPGVLTIRSRAKVSRKGVAAVHLSCSGSSNATCVGTLTLTTKVKRTAKRKVTGHLRTVTETKTITLGSARYSLAANTSQTLNITLLRAGVQLLRRAAGHKLKAKASQSRPPEARS
jgi:hypothetical protein